MSQGLRKWLHTISGLRKRSSHARNHNHAFAWRWLADNWRYGTQNRAFATSQIGDLVEKVSRAGYSVAHRCSVSAICPAAVAVARSSSDKAGSSPGGGGGGKAASAAKRKAATSTKSKSKDSTDAPAGNETEVAKADETPLAKAVRERCGINFLTSLLRTDSRVRIAATKSRQSSRKDSWVRLSRMPSSAMLVSAE